MGFNVCDVGFSGLVVSGIHGMTRRTTGVNPFHVLCEPKVAEAHERDIIWSVPPQILGV